MSSKRMPLAWKNLTHDVRRLLVACMGIGFAVLLMFVQVGFENALFESQVRIVDCLDGDIFLTSKAKFAIAAEKTFPAVKLRQASVVPGVESATPVYTDWTLSMLRNFTGNNPARGYRIRSIGVPPDRQIFESNALNEKLHELSALDSAFVDVSSKSYGYHLPVDDEQELRRAKVELAGKRLNLLGTFKLGTDFVNDGNLLMSDRSFARFFPQRNLGKDPLEKVDIGVVRVSEGSSPQAVKERIEEHLASRPAEDSEAVESNVSVELKSEFRERERTFWQKNTPIGIVFFAGKMIGFVVGVVICYQVIFSGISDHLPEYATLKAMGYGPDYFMRLITTEALYLSVMGFIPGTLVSYGLYAWLGNQTGLAMIMDARTLALVFGITVTMCVLSGLLAVRKLLTADPASLF